MAFSHFFFSLFAFYATTCITTTSCTAQTTTTTSTFTRFNCDDPNNVTDPAAFLLALDAAHGELRANLSSQASTGFAISERPRGAAPIFAIFHCRGQLLPPACLACLGAVFAVAGARCPSKPRATVFTDGCYLRYAGTNAFDEVINPGQSGFCDDPTPAEEVGGFNATAEEALAVLRREVLARNGRFVAGRKGAVYAAGECLPILRSEDCRLCMDSAVRNVEGCLPEAGGRAVESACYVRFSGEEFFNGSLAIDLNRPRDGGGKSGWRTVAIGASVGVGALLIFVFSVLFYRRHRSMRRTKWIFAGEVEGQTGVEALVSFTYEDLKHAAGNFSDENKLGQGGFSSVYKGVLRNGKVVAIKKLKISETSQARTDFESEVIIISNIHHRNLLTLLGCCRRGPDLLLVYEFMEKGSLDGYIFDGKKEALDWNKMFNIIVGSARGLAYLHEEFHHCIIHRDIKPGNILLDHEYQPKVGDFGLARLLPEDKTHVKTKLAGTLGYTAPEYVLNGKLSVKVDVYSFGVVILEILSGKKCRVTYLEWDNKYLLDWAWGLYENDKLMDLVDKSMLRDEVEEDEVKKVAEIGLMCTQSASKRPSMSDIVALLLSRDNPKIVLTRPNFITNNATNRSNSSDSSSTPASNGTMLFSHLSGR